MDEPNTQGKVQLTEAMKNERIESTTINTQRFYIVGANDFDAQEILLLDSLTSYNLTDARWALDYSAFIAKFAVGDEPSPLMDAYPVYTNMSIQPILAQYPWSLPF